MRFYLNNNFNFTTNPINIMGYWLKSLNSTNNINLSSFKVKNKTFFFKEGLFISLPLNKKILTLKGFKFVEDITKEDIIYQFYKNPPHSNAFHQRMEEYYQLLYYIDFHSVKIEQNYYIKNTEIIRDLYSSFYNNPPLISLNKILMDSIQVGFLRNLKSPVELILNFSKEELKYYLHYFFKEGKYSLDTPYSWYKEIKEDEKELIYALIFKISNLLEINYEIKNNYLYFDYKDITAFLNNRFEEIKSKLNKNNSNLPIPYNYLIEEIEEDLKLEGKEFLNILDFIDLNSLDKEKIKSPKILKILNKNDELKEMGFYLTKVEEIQDKEEDWKFDFTTSIPSIINSVLIS